MKSKQNQNVCDFNSDDFSLIQHITLGEKRKLFRFKFRVFSDACVRPKQEQFSKHIKTLLHNRRDSQHVVQSILAKNIEKKELWKRAIPTINQVLIFIGSNSSHFERS